MNIQMIGIDHNLAPVDIREKFTFTTAGVKEAMTAIRHSNGVDGCVLLSTCNRTELWISCGTETEPDLIALLCAQKGIDSAAYGKYFISRKGRKAVHYLFEMTSGLKSMILGEDQILAQVKKAQEMAREAECSDNVLEVLFRNAVTGAKKVKTELILSTANASAVEYAIARLKNSGLHFSGKKCLVIGNGEMGKRAANALTAHGADVTVTVRQYKSGIVEIPENCSRINYGERMDYLPKCDIVFSATSSPNTTIKFDDLKNCKLNHNMIFVDLAVPRDIDPAVQHLPYVTLYNIDDFSVPETEELKYQLSQAEKLIAEQEDKFMNWYECRDMIAAVDHLGQYCANEIDGRIGETVKMLGLSPEQNALLRHALEASSGKVLKKLIFAVRDVAGVGVFRQCVAAMESVRGDE